MKTFLKDLRCVSSDLGKSLVTGVHRGTGLKTSTTSTTVERVLMGQTCRDSACAGHESAE